MKKYDPKSVFRPFDHIRGKQYHRFEEITGEGCYALAVPQYLYLFFNAKTFTQGFNQRGEGDAFDRVCLFYHILKPNSSDHDANHGKYNTDQP